MSEFDATQWSVVLAAVDSESIVARRALATLCETYWKPLYVYVRHRGYSREEAEDLTQEFFAHIILRDGLRNVRQELGRFRSFLLVSLRNFLADEWDKSHAQKRGGDNLTISMDFASVEVSIASGAGNRSTPESIYEEGWAHAVLSGVLDQVESEYAESGKSEVFDSLKDLIVDPDSVPPYRELANHLGMSEGAVKTAAHRLRKRYRRALKEHVARTLADPSEVNDEIRHLISVLAG